MVHYLLYVQLGKVFDTASGNFFGLDQGQSGTLYLNLYEFTISSPYVHKVQLLCFFFQSMYYEKLPNKAPTGLFYREYNRTRTKKAIARSMIGEQNTEESIEESVDDLISGNFFDLKS